MAIIICVVWVVLAPSRYVHALLWVCVRVCVCVRARATAYVLDIPGL